MQLNSATTKTGRTTHNGAPASKITALQELRRTVMACMLWEDSFYENGKSVSERIRDLVKIVPDTEVATLAIQARTLMKLRHVPLLLVREMARNHSKLVKDTLTKVIQRPDELAEFLSIYWKEGKTPIAAQVKKGLAAAFTQFTEYQLAKYNRDKEIKLRDVLFLCHAKPINKAQGKTWKKLVDGKLETPDTWEVELSASKNKTKSWTRLLEEEKLGGLALIRNLRNMTEAKVDREKIAAALDGMKTDRILPFRFIAAARHAQDFEPELERAMLKSLASQEKLPGTTCLLVDVSGSMDDKISEKSDITRLDAACGLAILLREICTKVNVRTFSNNLVLVPARQGFALRDAITTSQPHGGTAMGAAIALVQQKEPAYDRMIVITDEQTQDRIPASTATRSYILNVAAYKNGVGYDRWTHIDGWSEAVVDFIREIERGGWDQVLS